MCNDCTDGVDDDANPPVVGRGNQYRHTDGRIVDGQGGRRIRYSQWHGIIRKATLANFIKENVHVQWIPMIDTISRE